MLWQRISIFFCSGLCITDFLLVKGFCGINSMDCIFFSCSPGSEHFLTLIAIPAAFVPVVVIIFWVLPILLASHRVFRFIFIFAGPRHSSCLRTNQLPSNTFHKILKNENLFSFASCLKLHDVSCGSWAKPGLSYLQRTRAKAELLKKVILCLPEYFTIPSCYISYFICLVQAVYYLSCIKIICHVSN